MGGGFPKDLLKVGLTRMAYHILGLTDDIRVTASNVDWGVITRHPHRGTWKWRKGQLGTYPSTQNKTAVLLPP